MKRRCTMGAQVPVSAHRNARLKDPANESGARRIHGRMRRDPHPIRARWEPASLWRERPYPTRESADEEFRNEICLWPKKLLITVKMAATAPAM